MTLDYKQTGKRLKLVRGRLTQEVFAASLGVSASYVKKTELGSKPSLKYLANIAAGYGISLDWLLLGDETNIPTGTPVIQPTVISENNAQYHTPIKPQNQPEEEDPEFEEMVRTLKEIMKSGDPDLRSWGKIQFRHAFDSYTARKNSPPSI